MTTPTNAKGALEVPGAPQPTEESNHTLGENYITKSPEEIKRSLEAAFQALPPGLRDNVRKKVYRAIEAHLAKNGHDADAARLLRDILPALPAETAAEILATVFPEPVWVVPDYLPAGLTILAGRPKVGKSWLALQICLALATGGQVFGKPVQKANVLYLALEDSKRRLQDRMKKQGWPPVHTVRFMTSEAFMEHIGYLNKSGLARLVHHMEREDLRLVIIDTFSRAVSGDQRDEAEMTQALAPLQAHAAEHDRAVLLIDHHAKPKGYNPDPVDDILGSTAKAAVADTAWGLYKEQGKRGARLSIRGRDVMEVTLELSFDMQGYYWHCEGEADALRLTRQRQEVLEVLDALGQATLKDIVDALDTDWDRHKGSIFKTLTDLSNAGLVQLERVGNRTLYTRSGVESA